MKSLGSWERLVLRLVRRLTLRLARREDVNNHTY